MKNNWLLDYVDEIAVINLETRPDRWNNILESFKSIGIDSDKVKRFNAIKHESGILGCTLSHYQTVKYAKLNNLKSIFILEDDAEIVNPKDFTSNCISLFNQIEKHSLSPDMVYLGGNIGYGSWFGDPCNIEIIDSNIFKFDKALCAHAYIVYEQMYDTIIDFYDELFSKEIIDFPQPHWIDVFYSKIHSQHDIFGLYPCGFNQFASYSDIENTFNDFDLVSHWDSIVKSKIQ